MGYEDNFGCIGDSAEERLISGEIKDFSIITPGGVGDKDVDGVCCFGKGINDEHSKGEIENEHSVVEETDDGHSVEDDNNVHDGGESTDDEDDICEDDGGKTSHDIGGGGDEEGIREDDSEVLFDVQLDVSSG